MDTWPAGLASLFEDSFEVQETLVWILVAAVTVTVV